VSKYPGYEHLVEDSRAPLCPRCGRQSGYEYEIGRFICPHCNVLADAPPPTRSDIEWGKERFQAQANPVRWAADILRTVADASGCQVPEVAAILETADHPSRWQSGHEVFDAARRRFLVERATPGPPEPSLYLLGLAELVAKVVYNQTQPGDPFDEDSGWYIAPEALRAADMTGGRDIRARVQERIDATIQAPPDLNERL
jgi:hypothetical protein